MTACNSQRKALCATAFGTALSEVPPDWDGHCALRLNGDGHSVAVFPDVIQAELAAKEAVQPRLGYQRAVVVPTTAEVTTPNGWAWAHA